MEEKKKFEALQYSYENAGQFRAIAAILGYSEEYRNGDITFSKGNETYTYPLNTLKLGNLGDNRESLLEQSKERIISFFDKEQASNNFQEYSQYLRKNHNVAIIKWDDIKQGTNKNEGYKDGFTVIDLENKIAYKGEDLYRYAYEQNQTLDGKGSYVDIDWNKFNEVGVKPENLSSEDIANIKNGKKTGMLNFSIEDTPGNRTLLDNEKVSYKTENGKLHFEGKATTLKYITAENTPENKSKLKANEIDFKEEGKRIKIDGINARKLAIAAITVVYPIAGIAILLIPKRQEIKNDLSFTKDEIKALKADNVYGITPISSFREQQLSQKEREANNKISLMVFMLVNVFFGIIGTFWLRMQNRKGEIGLRMALGAHRITLERYMYTEGLCLLAFTLPLLIIFAFNMVYMDQLDSYRQPLTFMRFLMTFGFTYLLMGVMICIGVWFPVRKVVRLAPAEALRYE